MVQILSHTSSVDMFKGQMHEQHHVLKGLKRFSDLGLNCLFELKYLRKRRLDDVTFHSSWRVSEEVATVFNLFFLRLHRTVFGHLVWRVGLYER